MSGVWGLLKGRDISDTAANIILQSWRDGTKKQFATYLRQWQEHCCEQKINPFSATVSQGINFLGDQYEKQKLSYSALNTARSALSLVILPPEGSTFGNHPLVGRLLRGIFTTRPSLPRYKSVWDVAIVLRYLKTLHPLSQLSLRELTLKLTMLIALLSGQRCQTIHALDINSMKVEAHPTRQFIFQINQLLKTSRPGKHFSHLVLQSYPEDKQLCICEALDAYVEKTKPLRENYTQLLISYQKPHQPVTTDTIGCWLRMVLDNSGIDTTAFRAHSTRAAATSAAKCANLSVNTIIMLQDGQMLKPSVNFMTSLLFQMKLQTLDVRS